MIEYARHLFQDAIETNWVTAKYAHMMVLQDIERGKLSWRNPDAVEKVRIRNTSRVIPPRSTHNQGKITRPNYSKDKICQDFNTGTCRHQNDHVIDGIIHRHACNFCFQEVGRFCGHKVSECLRRKSGDKQKLMN